jgi:protein ImuB
MLWIALHLPQLPLDTALRSQARSEAGGDACAARPVVVCERKRVGWCNPVAADAGIQPGMSDSNAHALAGDLLLFTRDETAETRALKEAALWCLHFTPHVTLRNAGILLEVAPSLRLFRGLNKLATQLLSGMQELGLQVQAACAPTATGAWLRAQGGDDVPAYSPHHPVARLLDPLPLRVMESAQPHLDTFSGIGCARLEQLRRLPRKGLARRFGSDLLRELDRAYGLEAEAHAWFEAPASFDAKLELLARVENAEALLFAARRLLLQLTGWLTARHAAVTGMTLQLHHESSRHRNHHSTLVQLALGMPSRDVEHLTLLLRERLARLDLEAPVIEVSLHADQVVELAAPNTELFPMPASDAESTERLVERLQSRLGSQAVQQLSLFADHRPECGTRITAYDGKRRQGTAAQDALPHSARLRPTWLLKEPIALVTRQHKPFYQSPLELLVGPERIEAGWWDDALVARDYFVAQNKRHMLLWIFRLRTIDETAGSGWFLHGFFG